MTIKHKADKHLFAVIYGDRVEWRNSAGAKGSDPAVTERGVRQILDNLRKRFGLTARQVETRDERGSK